VLFVTFRTRSALEGTSGCSERFSFLTRKPTMNFSGYISTLVQIRIEVAWWFNGAMTVGRSRLQTCSAYKNCHPMIVTTQ
jgi:hypothetical protein